MKRSLSFPHRSSGIFRSQRSCRSLTAALALATLCATTAPAQETPHLEGEPSSTSEANQAPALSLSEAIRIALEKNLALQVERLAPDIQEQGVIEQTAAFDPTVFSQARIGQSHLAWEDSDGDPRLTTSDSRSYVAGVTKRVVTGAQITASAAHSRNDGSSFNPDLNQFVGGGLSERASFELEVTQPLLQNRGADVNLAPLRRAQAQERAARFELRNAASELMQTTELAYWGLADAYARRSLRESNLELAERLLNEAEERERLGLATQLEVLQAKAALAQRREEIIRAEQAIADSADLLLAVMGVLDEDTLMASLPEVRPLPTPAPETPDFDLVLRTALERNFDTAIQEEILEQLEQDRVLAKNATRAELDVSLSGAYNGLSPFSAEDAFSEALDQRGDDWGLGLSFNLPWGRRASKANLRQTELRIDQAVIQLAAIKQDLLRSVRSAWRNLTLSREQLVAAKLAVELQEATLEQEQGRYEEGLSTVRDILETQRELDAAVGTLLDAQFNAVQAEVELDRVQGSLLQRHRIQWDALEPDPLPLPSPQE